MKYALLLILFLMIPFSFADYPQLGGQDTQYNGDKARFVNGTTPTEYIQNLLSPSEYPLSFDMDGDGTQEIIVVDDATFKMYDSQLNLIDGWPIDSYDFRGVNYVLGDHDKDGKGEIAYVLGIADYMTAVEWNGTEFEQIINDGDLAGILHDDGDCIIAQAVDKNGYVGQCINRKGGTSISSKMVGFFWNASKKDDTELLNWDGPELYDLTCFPEGATIQADDINKDGTIDYISNYFAVQSSGNSDGVYTTAFRINKNGNVIPTFNTYHNLGDIVSGTGGKTCYDEGYNLTEFVTNLVLGEFDGISSNGKEWAYAFRIDSGDRERFRLGIFENDGTAILKKPDLLGDYEKGRIISNTFVGDFFTDTGEEDPCVIGYNSVDDQINMLCLNPRTTEVGLGSRWYEWQFDSSNIGLVNEGFKQYSRITHSIEIIGGGNPDRNEVLTPYGTFKLNNDCTLNFCTMDYDYDSSRRKSVTIPTDIDLNGFSELLILQTNSLWLQYDDVQPQAPIITGTYSIDPCLEEPWEVNTTVSIRYTAIDADSPELTAWVELYSDTAYTVTSSNRSVVSGETITFNPYELVASTIDPNAKLRLYVSDGDYITSEELYFSVGLEGNTRPSSCVTSGVFETQIADLPTQCFTDSDCSTSEKCVASICIEKTPEDFTNEIVSPDLIPIGFRPFIGLFLIVGAVMGAVSVMSQSGVKDGAALTYVPIFSGIVAWIVAVIFGLLAAWTILFGLIVSSAIIGWKVYNTRMTS